LCTCEASGRCHRPVSCSNALKGDSRSNVIFERPCSTKDLEGLIAYSDQSVSPFVCTPGHPDRCITYHRHGVNRFILSAIKQFVQVLAISFKLPFAWHVNTTVRELRIIGQPGSPRSDAYGLLRLVWSSSLACDAVATVALSSLVN
jgi:hypothetical protein